MVVATLIRRGLVRLCMGHLDRCRREGRWWEPGWFRLACRLESALRGVAARAAVDVVAVVLVVVIVRGMLPSSSTTSATGQGGGSGSSWSGWGWDDSTNAGTPTAGPDRSPYGLVPRDPTASPDLREIPLPDFDGAYAIWGATGRDRRGHIWVGVSAHGVERPSAHLIEYDPEADRVVDRGDVVSQLERLGLARPGEGQMKIHSKIVPAPDGFLYFASMDEQGEATDGSRLPMWGSHLWRVRPEGGDWEHLLGVPEGLIAVAGAGRYIYALGYFDHALFQYDLRSGKVRSIRVGAAGGHISRNFLADDRGHAFVPRLARAGGADAGALSTTLVEFDASLRELAETPIRHYSQSTDDDSHGIVGVVTLADRSMVFATDRGFLYRIEPRLAGPSEVRGLGFIHPGGESYTASLFTYDGEGLVVGLSSRDSRHEWVVFDLDSGTSSASPVAIRTTTGMDPGRLLLYGSMTRDDAGRFYLAGTYGEGGDRSRPVLVQALPPSPDGLPGLYAGIDR